jgi:hypothetical protein
MIRARILAQLAETDRPMSEQAIAEALAIDVAEVSALASCLAGFGLARWTLLVGGRIGSPRARLLEITDAGRLEATGGAQLRIDGTPDRPPVDVQVGLF